jgi:hypothetical protein
LDGITAIDFSHEFKAFPQVRRQSRRSLQAARSAV